MERSTRPSRGQTFIEITLGVVVVTLVITLACNVALRLLKLFKHDYVERSLPVTAHLPLEKVFKNRLINFDKSSPSQNLRQLEDQGWLIEHRLPSSKGFLYFLRNGDQKMIFTQNLGVLTCMNDCETK